VLFIFLLMLHHQWLFLGADCLRLVDSIVVPNIFIVMSFLQ